MKLNETDRWLIERWEKLRQMENAMAGTRHRLETIFQEVHKKVRKIHPALDRMDVHMSPKELENYGGQVIFSKSSWPSAWETWRSGIYIWGITLDELSSDAKDGPNIYIFLQVKKSDPKIEIFRRRLASIAPKVFRTEKIKWLIEDEDDNRTLLWYGIPEGKGKLLKMLQNGKESNFIECLASHVGVMSKFVPILDKLLVD